MWKPELTHQGRPFSSALRSRRGGVLGRTVPHTPSVCVWGGGEEVGFGVETWAQTPRFLMSRMSLG